MYQATIHSIQLRRDQPVYYIADLMRGGLLAADLKDGAGQATIAWLDETQAAKATGKHGGIVCPALLGELAETSASLFGFSVLVVTESGENYIYQKEPPTDA